MQILSRFSLGLAESPHYTAFMPLAAFQYSLRVILIRNVPFGTHEAEVVRVSPPILFHSQYNQQKLTFFCTTTV